MFAYKNPHFVTADAHWPLAPGFLKLSAKSVCMFAPATYGHLQNTETETHNQNAKATL